MMTIQWSFLVVKNAVTTVNDRATGHYFKSVPLIDQKYFKISVFARSLKYV